MCQCFKVKMYMVDFVFKGWKDMVGKSSPFLSGPFLCFLVNFSYSLILLPWDSSFISTKYSTISYAWKHISPFCTDISIALYCSGTKSPICFVFSFLLLSPLPRGLLPSHSNNNVICVFELGNTCLSSPTLYYNVLFVGPSFTCPYYCLPNPPFLFSPGWPL